MDRIKRSTRNVFNSAQVKTLPEGYHADGGGLYLSVKGDYRSWIFRYSIKGKSRWMGLGATYDVTLSHARKEAAKCREYLRAGRDPITERDQRRDAVATAITAERFTFEHDARLLIDAKEAEWTPKHTQQWANTLEAYAFPVIGQKQVSSITTDDVLDVLKPIWQSKNETAKRVQGRIESVLDFATVLKHRKGENPARWVGSLDNLLPKPSKIKVIKPLEALPYVDMYDFMVKLRSRGSISAKVLEFTILTVARTTEAIQATWSEIDLAAKIWTIPGERMKSGQAHEVPLSPRVLALLKSLPKMSDYLFPGMKYGKPLSNMAMLTLLKRPSPKGMGYSCTVHGFRSSFRDWAGELTSYPSDVCEMALAHTILNKTEKAYRRGSMLAKRRKMMADWAKYIDLPPAKGNVRAIRGTK